MEELRKLHKVAYVRFASVYREFKDVSEFADLLDSRRPNSVESVGEDGASGARS